MVTGSLPHRLAPPNSVSPSRSPDLVRVEGLDDRVRRRLSSTHENVDGERPAIREHEDGRLAEGEHL